MFYVLAVARAMRAERKTSAGTGADMVFPFSLRFLPSRTKSAATRLVPASHVVATVHGTRTVLLDARSGHYWGLDEIGTRIWMLIQEQRSPEQIVETLAEEYDAPFETISSDVDAFIAKLRTERVVQEVS